MPDYLGISPLGAAALLFTLVLGAAASSKRLDHRRLRQGLAAAAALNALHLIVEGFFWQAVPSYALLAALGLRAAVGRAEASRLARAGTAVLTVVALLPWLALAPVPALPEPTGPYAVGTETFRLVDEARPEDATDAPDDRRNVIAQAWYPAAPMGRSTAPYLDGLGRLPGPVSVIPPFVMARWGRIDTHAVTNAPLADAGRRWPVVLLSPGYGASRSFYSGLAADLASRGFVTIAIDHPYESPIVELADERLVTPGSRPQSDSADPDTYMERQQSLRAADLRFVLDQLANPVAFGTRLAGRFDLSRIAAVGHSFGGAASALAATDDPRLAAAANLDGTPYGGLPERTLAVPFLLLESDREVTGHSERYLDGNAALFRNSADGGWRYELDAADHYGFTDAMLFLAPPARWALTSWIGGTRGPVATQRAAADLLSAFLSQALDLPVKERPEDVAARLPGVSGGRVEPSAPQAPK